MASLVSIVVWVMVAMALCNVSWQWFTHGDWWKAIERTAFQWVALSCVLLCDGMDRWFRRGREEEGPPDVHTR
jgi:hypothetical protein